jgi:hypothetical protein
MTSDDIIEAASKAGFETKRDMIWVDGWEITPTLTRFAALVAAAEREACLAEIELGSWVDKSTDEILDSIAAAIRARGQPDPKVTHLNEWARDRLARHGINPCPDCHGVGYDASGQLCWCQQNPSF